MLSHINVGTGVDSTIKELVDTIAEIVGFQGAIVWDSSKPDGTPRKLMDSSKPWSMGWEPMYDLRSGLSNAYDWYLSNHG
jgi:GDP-L-fucose synthase